MKEYIRERERQERTSRIVGGGLALGISVCAVLFCSFTGFKYIYPPPQENTFTDEKSISSASGLFIQLSIMNPDVNTTSSL